MEEFEKTSAAHIVSDTKVTRNPKLFACSKYILINGRKKSRKEITVAVIANEVLNRNDRNEKSILKST